MYRRAEKHCDKTTQFDANAIRTTVQNETKQNAIIQKICLQDNSPTANIFKIMELLYYICTLNLTSTVTLTLSNIGNV